MIKKLRRKFVIINMILVSAVLIFIFIALCVSTHTRLRLDTESALQQAIQGDGMKSDLRPEIGHKGGHRGDVSSSIPTFYVRVNTSGDILFADYGRVAISDENADAAITNALETGKTQGVIVDMGLLYRVSTLPSGDIAIAFADMSAEQSGMSRLIINSFIIGALGLIALFFVSVFLAQLAVKPVESAFRAQQQFIADASHELKTPLTVIMANTGVLKAHPNTQVSAHMQWIDSTVSEAGRMKGLVENMLELAKGDFSREHLVFGQVNLSDVVTNALLSFEPLAFEGGVALSSEVEPNLTTMGNGERLHRLVAILLDNGVKYAGRGGSAGVTLRQTGAHVILTVWNNGTVIPEARLSQVFNRFYRADESRNSEKVGGFGLGLAIAQQITEEHGAKIWVESGEQTGTVFSVQFKG